jgi:hypothetical protein
MWRLIWFDPIVAFVNVFLLLIFNLLNRLSRGVSEVAQVSFLH